MKQVMPHHSPEAALTRDRRDLLLVSSGHFSFRILVYRSVMKFPKMFSSAESFSPLDTTSSTVSPLAASYCFLSPLGSFSFGSVLGNLSLLCTLLWETMTSHDPHYHPYTETAWPVSPVCFSSIRARPIFPAAPFSGCFTSTSHSTQLKLNLWLSCQTCCSFVSHNLKTWACEITHI